MKCLNVGCGSRFSQGAEWVNIDISSTGEGVIAHNIISGLPFQDNSFDVVYHSHVLEHIPKTKAEFFIKECVRVLRPKGILRVAIPDLEGIVRNYIKALDKAVEDPDSPEAAANYDWMMIELYDQTVRNSSGGEMAKYLFQNNILNEKFVFERIGEEGKRLRNNFLNSKNAKKIEAKASPAWQQIASPKAYLRKIKYILSLGKHRFIQENKDIINIGKFRSSGEIHQWMYDRYSLSRIFKDHLLKEIVLRKANDSSIPEWIKFNLDTEPDGSVYKPDSLYMEGIKQ